MNLLNFIWIKFKTNPDIWFFYGFLITFTLSVRKVLFFYPLGGQFNEYTGIYLYLSDIFLFLTLVSWGILLLHNKYGKLSIRTTHTLPEANVPRPPAPKDIGTFRAGGTFLNQFLLFIPLALVIWSFTSTFWSQNEFIALFRSFKLLEMYFLFLFIALRIVPHGTIINNKHELNPLLNSFKIIVILALFQSIIAIWQFILQHSVGLFWLKESIISPDLPGVAKIILGGEKFIRAYGLFPHPNILGGFLLVSVILTWSYGKLFRPIKNVSRGTSGEYLNLGHSERSVAKSKNLIFKVLLDPSTMLGMTFLITVQSIALVLTFSKSAILGLILAIIYISAQNFRHIFNLRQRPTKWFLLGGLIILLAFLAIKPDYHSLVTKSVQERIIYLNVSRGTFLEHPWLGLGMGQYVYNLALNKSLLLENWQFQPVHNVFLLILSELGLVGLGLFAWFIWKLTLFSKSVPRPPAPKCIGAFRAGGTPCGELFQTASAVFLAFIVIMLFDHYLWDIQPGQILFWLAAGLLAGARRYKL